MIPLNELTNLSNKTVIVTGSANGIGTAICRRFAEQSCRIYMIDIDKVQNECIAKELDPTGTRIFAHELDISDKNEIDKFWNDIEGENVDILVNNAGVYPFKNFLKLDYDYLEKVMQVNLYSALWMCQNMFLKRGKKGGNIVNISSIEAVMPFKDDLTQYSLSKMGIITLTRDLAKEFSKKGYRVNAILPGGINSKGTRSAAKTAFTKVKLGLFSDAYNFFQRIPSGRLGEPDEVARIVLVLSSDLASYVTGALIPVDGGFLSS